jgi:hypothetical protein
VSDLADLFDDLDDGPAHSLLGASGAHRWMHCPGSFRLTQQAPPRPPSIYASRGTLAHTYIEETITAGDNSMPDLEVGTIRQVGQHAIEVDQDFVDGVNLMVSYVNGRQDDGAGYYIEFQVSLDPYFRAAKFKPPVPMFGRVDAAFIEPKLLEIVDYKNGSGILVEPRDNPQMLYYAAGVLVNLSQHSFNQVRLTVVQPHARTVEKVRSWTLSALDVQMWVDDELIPAVERCAQPDAPLVLGPWCRFCPAAFTCPRLAEEANKMAAREFSDDGLSLPSDPTKLGEWLTIAERAEVWIKALREFALEQMQRQVPVPGWSLGPTRPVRRWTDERRVGELLMARQFKLDQVYDVTLRSPAQIEKLLGKGKMWQQSFAPLVESHSSGVKIVHNEIASDFPEEG